MSDVNRLKVGDAYPFEYALKWDDGTPIDLSAAESVEFTMTKFGEAEPVIDADDCEIRDAALGKVRYTFTTEATTDPGMFLGVFTITFDDATVLHVPNDSELWFHVME